MSVFLLYAAMLWGGGEKMIYAAGYIPNVQFAPFYVAIERGYYEAEGIDLEMDYTMGPDVFKLTALGKVHVASADPDAFLNAVARGLPLTHLATLYQRYPLALISKQELFTETALKGKRVGISGTYGSSYLGLKAMLAELGLSLKDIRVNAIGYTQVASLQQDRVDVVVGYINNEPIRLASQDVITHTYMLEEGNGLPGVGLMVSRKYKERNGKLVDGFLRATFRGMHDVLQDPKTCYQLVVDKYLPQLKGEGRYEGELAILQATLPFWEPEAGAYGQCPKQRWKNLVELLNHDQASRNFSNWHQWVDRDFSWTPEK